MVFPGFNHRKKGTISKGDFDRDGVNNRKDCEPLNFRKQGEGHGKRKPNKIKTYSVTNCPGCGKLKPHRYPGPCDECDVENWEDIY